MLRSFAARSISSKFNLPDDLWISSRKIEISFVINASYSDMSAFRFQILICNREGIPYDNIVFTTRTRSTSINEFQEIHYQILEIPHVKGELKNRGYNLKNSRIRLNLLGISLGSLSTPIYALVEFE